MSAQCCLFKKQGIWHFVLSLKTIFPSIMNCSSHGSAWGGQCHSIESSLIEPEKRGMLYSDGETLDLLVLCVVIQMKASQKNNCDSVIVDRDRESGFECFPFLCFSLWLFLACPETR